MKTINAFGMACPKPLVLAKKELDGGCDALCVQVDNETAVNNLTRLAQQKNRVISIEGIDGGWAVRFNGLGSSTAGSTESSPLETVVPRPGNVGCGYAVFVGKEQVGAGEAELGRNLMKMALYTFSEADQVPSVLLFMNGGVKLLTSADDQIVKSVRALEERGTEVLVCGTCLDFYGLKDALAVGEVSNMYDILKRMCEVSKVITL